MPPPPRRLVALLGATASGKTAVAIEVARRLPVEVIAADSRQLRRGMVIGTAAPSARASDQPRPWFDEVAVNAKYGECRGTGVLVHLDGAWRIAQYNLSIPIPNEIALEVVGMIRGLE